MRILPNRAWLRRAIACALLGAALGAQGQEAPPTEYQVKAAFLYNFGRFVEWPQSAAPASAFTICVLGKDPFGKALDKLIQGKSLQGRKLAARRLERVEDAGDCRILFISPSEDARLTQILAGLRGRSVLTVGEAKRFAERGGMINFRLEAGRVRFEINPEAAAQAGLTISSQLLRLATIVHQDSQTGA